MNKKRTPAKRRKPAARKTLTSVQRIAQLERWLSTLNDTIADLIESVDHLTDLVESLPIRRDVSPTTDPWPGTPWNPDPAPTIPVFPQPRPIDCDFDRCKTCGNRFKDMSHYVCGHSECPSRVTYGTPSPSFYAGTPKHLLEMGTSMPVQGFISG